MTALLRFLTMVGGLVLSAALIDALPADAASDRTCQRYAQDAVQQQRDNLRLGCGFGGAAWHEDIGAHFGWCRGQAAGTLQVHTSSRQNELSACRQARRDGEIPRYGDGGGPRGGGFCDAYARAAMEDQTVNLRRGCGFGGSAWHSNYDGHIAWCRTVARETAIHEERARRATLQNSC